MSVTKNFLVYLVAGGAVTALAWVFGGVYQAVFLFWNLLLAILYLLDMVISPSGKRFEVRRGEGDILYFRHENEVELYVKNNSRFLVKMQLREENVRHFSHIDINMRQWLEPSYEEIFSYVTVPGKRGSFNFGRVFLRWEGVLGLCVKHAAAHCPVNYKVYPNVKDLSKFRLLMQKSRLLPQGDKNLKLQGLGYEFESLRPYVQGDDYRRINWQATARENKPIMNKYQIERNQPVYILLDISRPMSYSVGGIKKLDYAINAAIILSDIVNQSGDKVGLITFDSRVQAHVPPGQGAAHRNRLMETLYNVQDNRQTADYYSVFHMLCERQKRRSLVFIFTDFELPEEAREMIANLGLLKKRHTPVVVFMKNESLQALAESKPEKQYDAYVQSTAAEFLGERKDIFRHLTVSGVPNVESKAEEFALSAVNRYLMIRGQR